MRHFEEIPYPPHYIVLANERVCVNPLQVQSNNYCTNATLHVDNLPYSVAGEEHVFVGVTPSGTFTVQADKEEDKQDWVRALKESV